MDAKASGIRIKPATLHEDQKRWDQDKDPYWKYQQAIVKPGNSWDDGKTPTGRSMECSTFILDVLVNRGSGFLKNEVDAFKARLQFYRDSDFSAKSQSIILDEDLEPPRNEARFDSVMGSPSAQGYYRQLSTKGGKLPTLPPLSISAQQTKSKWNTIPITIASPKPLTTPKPYPSKDHGKGAPNILLDSDGVEFYGIDFDNVDLDGLCWILSLQMLMFIITWLAVSLYPISTWHTTSGIHHSSIFCCYGVSFSI